MSRDLALVLTPRLPWPLDDGGRIAMWQTVWSCAQEFRTEVISLDSGGKDDGAREAFRSLGVGLTCVPHTPPSRLAAAVRGLASPVPDPIARYRSPAFDAAIRSSIARERPLFALVNHLYLAGCADALGDVPFVLRQQNAEALWLERYARTRRNPAVRLYAEGQVRKMRAAETRICERADLVLAIQREEGETLRRLAPNARIEVVPLGIDFGRYALPRSPGPAVVLASATWSWPPNAEGMDRFVEHGWPLVRARRKDARLRVAGKGLPADLAERWRNAGAEIEGYVESMADEFARAALLIVPLWTGAGIRVKIVEAAAASLPVVTTPRGAEGLELEPDLHYALGDTPQALAEAVVSLLETPVEAQAMARRAFERAQHEYDLARVARRMNELCRDAARSRTAAR